MFVVKHGDALRCGPRWPGVPDWALLPAANTNSWTGDQSTPAAAGPACTNASVQSSIDVTIIQLNVGASSYDRKQRFPFPSAAQDGGGLSRRGGRRKPAPAPIAWRMPIPSSCCGRSCARCACRELLKPDLVQADEGISSTVVIFGSAWHARTGRGSATAASGRAGGECGPSRQRCQAQAGNRPTCWLTVAIMTRPVSWVS